MQRLRIQPLKINHLVGMFGAGVLFMILPFGCLYSIECKRSTLEPVDYHLAAQVFDKLGVVHFIDFCKRLANDLLTQDRSRRLTDGAAFPFKAGINDALILIELEVRCDYIATT